MTTGLETKIGVAEAKLFQHFKETKEWKEALVKRDDEIKTLKNVIKDKNTEQTSTNLDLNNLKKKIKAKEKEFHDLEKTKLNQQDTIKNLKDAAKDAKKERTKAEKELRNLEKKILKVEERKALSETNNNDSVSASSLRSSITSLKNSSKLSRQAMNSTSCSNAMTNSLTSQVMYKNSQVIPPSPQAASQVQKTNPLISKAMDRVTSNTSPYTSSLAVTIPVSNSFNLLDCHSSKPEEDLEKDSKDFEQFGNLIPQERRILEQIRNIIQGPISQENSELTKS